MKRIFVTVCCLALIALFTAACGNAYADGPKDGTLGDQVRPAEENKEPDLPDEPVSPGETEPSDNAIPDDPIPEEPSEPEKTGGAVPESFFDDALFIGDSRTVGLRDYARLGKADYFCSVGMSVFNIYDQKVSDTSFSARTLADLLRGKTYGTILVGLGLNESGYPMENIVKGFDTLIETLRAAQPEAVIVLQAILTVGRDTGKSYLTPGNISAINARISALADGEKVFYIDVNPVFADSAGYLPDDLTSDGCHLYAKYYDEWDAWLCEALGELKMG